VYWFRLLANANFLCRNISVVSFCIQKGLKQEYTLSLVLFRYTWELAIWKVWQKSRLCIRTERDTSSSDLISRYSNYILELNGTHRRLIWPADIRITGENINPILRGPFLFPLLLNWSLITKLTAFCPEYGGSTWLQNVGLYLSVSRFETRLRHGIFRVLLLFVSFFGKSLYGNLILQLFWIHWTHGAVPPCDNK
jgi:hypothetical protein